MVAITDTGVVAGDKCAVEQNEHHIRIKVGCMEIYAESNDMHDLITVSHADNSPLRFEDQKIVDIANGEIFDLSKDLSIVSKEVIKDLTKEKEDSSWVIGDDRN